MARQTSRITVIDSMKVGTLQHSIYAITYLPSWIRIRQKFRWKTTLEVFQSVGVMKEYFTSAKFEDRPFRAQRCLYTLKSLFINGYKKNGAPRFSSVSRTQLNRLMNELRTYLEENPVVAWDWIVVWAECRAMAEAYPDEFIKLFRSLRSRRDTKRKPKPEMTYFIELMRETAIDSNIELERK